MKMLMTMLVMSLALTGCGVSDEPTTLTQNDVLPDTVNDIIQEADTDVDAFDIDIMSDTVEVSEVSFDEQPDVSEEEDPEQLDEDPTSFRSNPDPGSQFFVPEIP